MTTGPPLPRRGQFPILTSIRLSRTGRRPINCPIREIYLRLKHKVAKREQTKAAQVFNQETTVVEPGNALELHTSDAFANPLVKAMQLRLDIRKGSSEIVGKPGDNAIDRLNGDRVEIMGADGNRADIVFKFLQRLGSDRDEIGGEVEAEEVKAPKERSDGRLFKRKLEGEMRMKGLIDKSQSLFSEEFGTAKNDEIIRKADKPKVGLRQSKVELVKDNVSQKGRNDPALRRTLVYRKKDAVFKNPSGEKQPDNVENVTISDPLSNQINEQIVGDVVEASRNIGIDEPAEASVAEVDDSLNGLMLIATRPEPEGKVREDGFKNRLKQGFNHSLSDPVSDSGDAKRTQLPFPFGDVNPKQRQGLVLPPMLEVSHQSEQILLKVSLKHLDGDTIDASRAPIAFDGNKGLVHPGHINTTGQGMNFGRQSEPPKNLKKPGCWSTGEPRECQTGERLFRQSGLSKQERQRRRWASPRQGNILPQPSINPRPQAEKQQHFIGSSPSGQIRPLLWLR